MKNTRRKRQSVRESLDDAFELFHEERFSEATRILRRFVRSDDLSDAVVARRALGDIARLQGRYRAARTELAHALKLARKLGDPEQLAYTFNSLGIVCKYEARFPEGIRHYRKALALAERLPKPGAQEFVATLYHNLGGLEFSAGRYAAAEPLARRSVTLRAKFVKKGDPALLADQAALAAILDAAGKTREAESIYRDALPRFQKLGMSYDVAANQGNLAVLLLEQGKLGEARGFFQKSLRGLKRLFGSEHPEITLMLHNLGMLESRAGREHQARKLLTEAYTGFQRLLGARHPSTVTCAKALRALSG